MRLLITICCTLLALNHAYAGNSSLFMAYISGNWAPLSGYLQIPAGGVPGSSSIARPRLSEIGINQSPFFETGAVFDSGILGIYGIYQYLRPTGNRILDQNITTHGINIIQGTSISTDNKFDLYRIGIFHSFGLFNFSIYPELEGTLLNFNYQISTPAVATSRGFNSLTFRVGLGASLQLTSFVGFMASAETSIPNVMNLQVQTAKAEVDFTVYQQLMFQLKLFGNVGYERIYFEDHQTLPNKIDVRAFPVVAVGIRTLIC